VVGVESEVTLITANAALATSAEHDTDVLLTTEAMADRMGLTREQLNRRGPGLPFRVKLGHRTVRWSLRGYHKWLKKLAA
jgi:predicted DNA-binding transcriptional regulator AlpA